MPKGAALEVGCGAGTLLFEMAKLGWQNEAIESSHRATEIASDINKDFDSFRIHSELGQSLESRFDLLMAFEVLEHIEHDLDALNQWKASLKPKGKVLISVPAHQHLWNPSDVWAGHFRRYSRDDVEKLLQSAGFEVNLIECYGYPLANLLERIRAYVHGRDLKRSSKGHIQERSNRSGVERSIENRLFPLQTNWLGRQFMRAALGIQARFIDSDMGTGYLALGTLKG
jgi:SAM-dependent methyltransferase